MMKMKQKMTVLALLLSISAFFMPLTAYAQGGEDTTPPEISATLSGSNIHIEASDEGSGIDAVFIGGRRAEFTGTALDVPFSEYAEEGQRTLEIYAKDLAGNQSETVEVTKREANPFTPDGQATVVDNATDEDGKEFYTFTTPDENVFYLVIDRQRDSDNVYFLNAVTEEDLYALAEKAQDGNGTEGMTAEPETCTCAYKCEPGMVDVSCQICRNDLTACTGQEQIQQDTEAETAETEKEQGSGNAGAAVLAVIAALAAGGAGYYFKIYRPKRELDDAEDLDELFDDGPEVNEDNEGAAEAQAEALQTGRNGTGTDAESDGQGADDGPQEPEMTAHDSYPYDDYPDDGEG